MGGYWKFQGGGGLKGQILLKFPEEWKVSNQTPLGMGEYGHFVQHHSECLKRH